MLMYSHLCDPLTYITAQQQLWYYNNYDNDDDDDNKQTNKQTNNKAKTKTN